MTRRAFTLIELTFVVALMGILVALAFPFVRDGTSRAKAANLVELAHVTRTAYIAAGEPSANSVSSPLGEVPALLAKTLTAGSFRTADGISMHVVGIGRQVYLSMRGGTPAARQVLALFHLEHLDPHTFLSTSHLTMVLVPLGEEAVVQVGTAGANGGGTTSIPQTPVTTPSQGTPNPQLPQQPPQGPQPPQVQPPSQPQQPAQVQRPQTQSQPQSQEQTSTCSASLSPGQFKHCSSAQSGQGNQHHGQGWFRNPH